MPYRVKYEANQKVGQWTLLKRKSGQQRQGQPRIKPKWLCRCTCGAMRWVDSTNLANGSSLSCGHGQRQERSLSKRNVKPVNSVFGLGLS